MSAQITPLTPRNKDANSTHSGFDSLPEGWSCVTLPVIAEIVMGQSPPSTSYNTEGRGIPFFQGKAEFGDLYPTTVKYSDQPGKIAERDDILITIRAPVGPTNLCATRSCIGRGLAAIRPISGVPSLFVLYYLRSIERWLATQGTGSTFTAINKNDLAAIEIPLPPLAEQRRIVAKLEALLAQVTTAQQRLSRIPALLKRFRQSVLAAACSGRLTADWREEHDDVEHALDLLKKIDNQREAAAKRGTDKRGHVVASIQRVERLSSDDCPENSIPDTWSWVRFGSVIGELRNGVGIRPSIEPPGTPILRISAARPGNVDVSAFRFMPDSARFLPLYQLRNEDLLFTRYNGSLELLGICGMVRGLTDETILYPDKLMRVRFDHRSIEPGYAEIFFQDTAVHERIIAKSKSSAGQNGVSGMDIKNQPFAVPPAAEQREIIQRVEQLFALADRIESRLQAVQERVDRLTQSLLAKAFRGELVPTEAELARQEGREYESAEELLARLSAVPEQPATAKKKGRRKG
jgi:type I restriction enzyme S subunit